MYARVQVPTRTHIVHDGSKCSRRSWLPRPYPSTMGNTGKGKKYRYICGSLKAKIKIQYPRAIYSPIDLLLPLIFVHIL